MLWGSPIHMEAWIRGTASIHEEATEAIQLEQHTGCEAHHQPHFSGCEVNQQPQHHSDTVQTFSEHHGHCQEVQEAEPGVILMSSMVRGQSSPLPRGSGERCYLLESCSRNCDLNLFFLMINLCKVKYKYIVIQYYY